MLIDITRPIDSFPPTDGIMTHIDIFYQGKAINPDRFISRGVLVDVSAIASRSIGAADIDPAIDIQEGDLVIFRTGWDQFAGSEQYADHPELGRDLLDHLIERKVGIIGIDSPGLARGDQHNGIDQYMVDHDIFIIEHLIGLDRIGSQPFRAYCFPLNITGYNWQPIRVIVDA
jgi:kynurenine formamidase